MEPVRTLVVALSAGIFGGTIAFERGEAGDGERHTQSGHFRLVRVLLGGQPEVARDDVPFGLAGPLAFGRFGGFVEACGIVARGTAQGAS